jgi:hypothetical protein
VVAWYEGLRLAEVVQDVPGLKCRAAAQGVERLAAGLESDAEARRSVGRLGLEMSKV